MTWRKALVLGFEFVCVCMILLISVFIHELGHIVIGSLLDFNYKGLIIGPYFLFMATRFEGTYPVFGTFLFVRLAGGVFQGLFFLIVTRFVPEFRREFRAAAIFCFIYAILEVISVV